MEKTKEKTLKLYSQITARNYGVYALHEQEKLRKSHVCIVGLGCIGGVVTLTLGRLGIGKMTIVDGDRYELPNINRQPMALRSTLHNQKVDVAKNMLLDINPMLILKPFKDYFALNNAKEILDRVDIVIQCVDDMKTRCILHRCCLRRNIPSLTMSGQPPFRSIVSTLLPGGPNYETVFGLPEVSGMSNEEISRADELFKKFKVERAKSAVLHGADGDWEKDFESSNAGWAVTPERTYVSAILQVHECVRVLLGKPPLAPAPQAIIVDLADTPNIVRIGSPTQAEKLAVDGHWDYRCF